MGLFCTKTGLDVITDPSWSKRKIGTTLEVNFRILGGDIIYCRPEGKADIDGIKATLDLYEEIIEGIAGARRRHVLINDWISYKGSTADARRYLMSRLNEIEELHSIVFCNVPLHCALWLRFARSLSLTKKCYILAKNYKEAIHEAMVQLGKSPMVCDREIVESGFQVVAQPEEIVAESREIWDWRSDIPKLKTLINHIDWDEKGLHVRPEMEVEEKTPLYPLFQSIQLIKEEVDGLLEERSRYEEELYNSRMEIAESQAKLSLALEVSQMGQWEGGFQDREREFIFNDQFYSIYGTSAEEEGGYEMSAQQYAERFLLPEDRWVVEDELKNFMVQMVRNTSMSLIIALSDETGKCDTLLYDIRS